MFSFTYPKKLNLPMLSFLFFISLVSPAQSYANTDLLTLINNIDQAAEPIAKAGTNTLGDLKPIDGVSKISDYKSTLKSSIDDLKDKVKSLYGELTYAQFVLLILFLDDMQEPASDIYAYRIPWNTSGDPFSVVANKVNWLKGGSAQTKRARNGAILIRKILAKLRVSLKKLEY